MARVDIDDPGKRALKEAYDRLITERTVEKLMFARHMQTASWAILALAFAVAMSTRRR